MLMQGWSVELTLEVVTGAEELDVVVGGASVEVELTLVDVGVVELLLRRGEAEGGRVQILVPMFWCENGYRV